MKLSGLATKYFCWGGVYDKEAASTHNLRYFGGGRSNCTARERVHGRCYYQLSGSVSLGLGSSSLSLKSWLAFGSYNDKRTLTHSVKRTKSVDEILMCDYSNENDKAVLSFGTVYLFCFS